MWVCSDLGEWGVGGEPTGLGVPPGQGQRLVQIQALAKVLPLGIEGIQLGGTGPMLLPLMAPVRVCLKKKAKLWLKGNLGEGNGNHSSTLAWKIPWTEEPGGLQSTASQRVGHD